MEIQVLRKKSQDDSKEIAKLKYENEDLKCCLMTSMEDNDSLKKQIRELKETGKHCSTPDQKPVVVEVKMKSDIASLKSSIQQLDKKFLEAAHNNDVLHKSNKSLLEKIDLLKDEVKEQKCKASKAEFEVESLRRCKHDLTQQLQILKCREDNINRNSNAYNRPYQGFGSPNVRKLNLISNGNIDRTLSSNFDEFNKNAVEFTYSYKLYIIKKHKRLIIKMFFFLLIFRMENTGTTIPATTSITTTTATTTTTITTTPITTVPNVINKTETCQLHEIGNNFLFTGREKVRQNFQKI